MLERKTQKADEIFNGRRERSEREQEEEWRQLHSSWDHPEAGAAGGAGRIAMSPAP